MLFATLNLRQSIFNIFYTRGPNGLVTFVLLNIDCPDSSADGFPTAASE